MHIRRDAGGKIDQVYKWPNENATEALTEEELTAEVQADNVVEALKPPQ